MDFYLIQADTMENAQDNLILKHNDLSKVTRDCPSIYEIDFINSCLSGNQIYKRTFPESIHLPVDIDNFARNRGLTRAKAYRIILGIIEKMKREEIEFELTDKKTWHTNLIHGYITDKSDNSISIQWNKEAIYLISGTMLPGTFCYYDKRMGGLSSKKRYLLYELLQRYLYKDSFYLKLETIRKECCVDIDEYKEFKDLQKRLIKPTLEDIKEKLGIEIISSKSRGDDKVLFVKVKKEERDIGRETRSLEKYGMVLDYS